MCPKLIDDGPDRVEFYPSTGVADEYGDTVEGVSDEPIVLHVHLQRVSAEELDALGVAPVRTVMRFATSTPLPADAGAQVRARGRRWEVIGEPSEQGRSERTRHTRVVIRAIEAQA